MNRYARKKEPILPKKEKIELSTKNIVLRIIGFILFFIIGIGFLVTGLRQCVNGSKGWNTIETDDAILENANGEIELNYYLSGLAEGRQVRLAYTSALSAICSMTSVYYEYDDYVSIKKIMNNPNTELELNNVLYIYLKDIYEKDPNLLFLQPIYDIYDNLFIVHNIGQENDSYNPSNNTEFFSNVISNVNSNKINLEFKDNNIVKFTIDDTYKAYLDENNVCYFGLGNMWSSVILDYVGNTLNKEGYTKGYLASKKGLIYRLNDCDKLNMYIYSSYNSKIYNSAVISNFDYKYAVSFNDYILSSYDNSYKVEINNEIVSSIYSKTDGLNHYNDNYVFGYSSTTSIVDLYYELYQIYSENLGTFSSLVDIDYVYTNDLDIHYSSDSISLNISQFNNVNFNAILD